MAAVKWLFKSQDVTGTGGSAASYNLFLGWEAPYPETTGYIIPTLYDVSEWYNFPEARERAEKMAEWLLSVQLPSGAFPAGTYSEDGTEPSVFNTGQILRGLVRANQETNNEKYRESAVSAIRWLSKVQRNDGRWDTFDYNGTSHAYSSRISWPVLEAAEEFDVELGYEVASANLRWVLSQQRENDWFERSSFDGSDTAYLHTIAYTIRGLLESAILFDGDLEKECEKAAKATAERLLHLQNENKILLGVYDSTWNPVGEYRCLTGNAQMAIVWGRLFEMYENRKYLIAMEESVDYLTNSQTLHGPPSIHGGIRGSDPVWGNYMYFRYPNWASKFFIDALMKWNMLEE
ncbi:prenyltransferase/squalene oxidase repeat-containing protein [Haladaptatus sp. GCM10025707]|uniref:prenyltransferase/squalene oxidase repeat-containing protein n=1 Tax=unclassified Haladaptatus TaxID=2622732 RepID=UPI0023E8E965|nr:prenyltransferase/squalene oxidase repeat-containing protein [Haladaptatus sp. QDMS2]